MEAGGGGGGLTLQRNEREGNAVRRRGRFRQAVGGRENLLKTCLHKQRDLQQASDTFQLQPWRTATKRAPTCKRPASFSAQMRRDYLGIINRKLHPSTFFFLTLMCHQLPGVLPCTHERSSTRWCCRKSRIPSLPRWKRSRSCRHRPRGFRLAGSPRCTPSQQRWDLFEMAHRRKKKTRWEETHGWSIYSSLLFRRESEERAEIKNGRVWFWTARATADRELLFKALANGGRFILGLSPQLKVEIKTMMDRQPVGVNGVYLEAILKSFPSSVRLPDPNSCKWLVHSLGSCWPYRYTVHHLEGKKK